MEVLQKCYRTYFRNIVHTGHVNSGMNEPNSGYRERIKEKNLKVKFGHFIVETDFVYMLLFTVTERKVEPLPPSSIKQWAGECWGMQATTQCLSLDQGFREFSTCNSLSVQTFLHDLGILTHKIHICEWSICWKPAIIKFSLKQMFGIHIILRFTYK